MSTTVTLTRPLKRGDKEIAEISLHEPTAGTLRGLSVNDVINGKADAIITLTPRISDPKLTEAEMSAMNMRDLALISGEIVGFLLTEEEKKAAMADLNSLTE